VLNDLNKLKVKNWTYLVKEREARYEVMQKTKAHKVLWCQQQQQNNNKGEE
jgi:hypothetical protein